MKKTTLTFLFLALVVAGAIVFVVYSSQYMNAKSASTTVPQQLITSLAYAHWKSIGDKNIPQIMSQYSAHYEVLWWFVNGTQIGPQNGRYDCNIPRGASNCGYFLESAWNAFFNQTNALEYTVCNFSLTSELSGRATVTADVYFSLVGLNETIHVPYDMDFLNYNGTWAVMRDWFGTSEHESTVLYGVALPSCTA